MVSALQYLINYHPAGFILVGTGFLGLCAGVLGCFALAREKSLFGDTMAHACLPGIVTFFLLSGSTNPIFLLLGGMLSSALGAALIFLLQQKTHLKPDTILAYVLSFFFGTGVMLMTLAHAKHGSNQAVLGKFLFGNAALLLHAEVFAIIFACSIILAIIIWYWQPCVLYSFDPVHSYTLGYRTAHVEMVITILMICLIGLGLQTVGVMLITTLLIAPAAAAAPWTQRITSMAYLSGIFGIIATTCGTLISYYVEAIPTGPAIVVVATTMAFCSVVMRTLLKAKKVTP